MNHWQRDMPLQIGEKSQLKDAWRKLPSHCQ